MRVFITEHEEFPVYSMEEPELDWEHERAVEIPDKLWAEYVEVQTAYEKMQNVLSGLHYTAELARREAEQQVAREGRSDGIREALTEHDGAFPVKVVKE